MKDRVAFSILVARLFMRLSKALSRWCFSALVDKSVESCPIFSTTVRRSELQPGGCLGISCTFRATRETNTSSGIGRTHRENDAYVKRALKRNIWTKPAGSETTIYNVDRESRRPVVQLAHGRSRRAITRILTPSLGAAGAFCRPCRRVSLPRDGVFRHVCLLLSLSLSRRHCAVLNSSDKEHRVTCLPRVHSSNS